MLFCESFKKIAIIDLPEQVRHDSAPERVAKDERVGDEPPTEKVAVVDLPEESRYLSLAPMQDYVPGSNLDKETGQRRQVNARTQNVQNEDREMNPKLRHNWKSTRSP